MSHGVAGEESTGSSAQHQWGQTPGLGEAQNRCWCCQQTVHPLKESSCCSAGTCLMKLLQQISQYPRLGVSAPSDFSCGTGDTLAIPRVSVPPLGPARCLAMAAEWDLFIGHPAPCKTWFIGR